MVPMFQRVAVFAVAFATGCSYHAPQEAQSAIVPASGQPAKRSPVPCSELSTLRALNRQLNYVENPSTGDTLEYLVLGDGALGNDVLVYFPGTGEMIPTWPVQLITNSKYSPRIVGTKAYRKNEDGSVSLCHDYRIVLLDYPGVGKTPSKTYTRDDVASDVDNMLQEIARTFRISTATVDPVGWSLGTTFALKYAFLSPVSRPSRTIHNVILYAGHGGGSEQADNSGEASCTLRLFEASLSAKGRLDLQIKRDLSQLIFPYEGQGPRDNGTHSGCWARVTKRAVHLSVTPVCTPSNGCTQYIDGYLADVLTYPWRLTRGIDDGVYTQEREQSGDWNVVYCARALPEFRSASCTAYGNVQQSKTNGGVCKTDTANPNKPVAVVCDKLTISGKVTLFDGYEDLFVQWTYDRALADGLNAAKPGSASYAIIPESSGHGILIQHPKWTQAQTYAAMQH